VSEQDIVNQSEILFGGASPIPFRLRANVKLDNAIAENIENCSITIPIVHVFQKQYLIGPKIYTCDLKNENVFILVGGGF
jgi:hypothetical protein